MTTAPTSEAEAEALGRMADELGLRLERVGPPDDGGAGAGAAGAAGAAGGGAAARAAMLGGSASFMEDEDLPEEVEGSVAQEEYTSSYNRLVYCALPQVSTVVASYPAPPVFLSQSLARLAAAHPAAQGIIAASTYAAAVAALPKA